jgi:hypothetical protein
MAKVNDGDEGASEAAGTATAGEASGTDAATSYSGSNTVIISENGDVPDDGGDECVRLRGSRG